MIGKRPIFVLLFICCSSFVFSQDHCPGDDWGDWDEPCKGCLREHSRKCNADDAIAETKLCIIDPCECHVKLDDERRSTAFILPKVSAGGNCDLGIRPAWYRFTSGAGGMMATSCPKERACGSKAAIWLKGDHPKAIGEITKFDTRVSYDGDCDFFQGTNWKIQSKKCQSEDGVQFFTYKLEPVPSCPLTYCAGSEMRCPADQSSPTGFTPGCSDHYPKLRKDPIVTASPTANGNIQLKCTLEPIETTLNVRHEVEWIQGDNYESIYNTLLKGNEREAVLENKKGQKIFFLPNKFSCKVRSYFSDKLKETGKGKPKSSAEIFAGIIVEPKTMTFSENEQQKWIKIYSTVDIPSGDCPVTVKFRQAKGDVRVKSCVKCFKSQNKGLTKALEVEVVRKQFDKASPNTMFIRMSIIPSLQRNVRLDWRNSIHEVTVVLKKTGAKTCSATGDPHFRTFDRLYYHMYHVGDYVMMGTAGDKTEIHMRTHVCNRRVSCICGIAVRYGDDVIALDMCRGGLKLTFPSRKPLNPSMKVSKIGTGKNFRITTPDAVKIDFNGYTYGSYIFANVYITAMSDYRERTFGMCGNNNGNPNDDLKGERVYNAYNGIVAPLDYTSEWKLPLGASLFYYKPGKMKCEKSEKKFCTCKEESIECSKTRESKDIDEGEIEIKPEDKVVDNCWQNNVLKNNLRIRRSNSKVIVVPIDDEDGSDYVYNPQQTNFTDVSFPTKSGITEDNAKEECTKAITESTFGKACLQIYPNLTYTLLVNECVEDVKILDDLKAPKSSIISSFTELCKFTVIEDDSLYSNDTGNDTLQERQFEPPQFLIQNLCANDCSSNGVCVNSTCFCKDGYITNDCSMKNDTVPTFVGISNHGICDIRKRDCRRAKIIGNNFIDSPKLSCRATEVRINDGKTPELTSKLFYDNAYLLTFSELICELPEPPVKIDGDVDGASGRPIGGFSISMSNDGLNYSKKEKLFVIFDGKCMNCTRDGSGNCNQITNTCLVNNYCFSKKEINPNNWCQVCNPTLSTASFSNRTNSENAAPIFNASVSFSAIKGQKNEHQLNATDPEGKGITYRIIGENHGILCSKDGVLSWIPNKVNTTYTLKVLATDICGRSTKRDIILTTKQCLCEGKNDGYCKWKVGNEMVCVCPDGCQGLDCSEPVVGKTCKVKVRPTKPAPGNGEKETTAEGKSLIYMIAGSIAGVLLLVLVIAFFIRRKCKASRSASPLPMKDIGEKVNKDDVTVTPVVKFQYENKAEEEEN